MMFKCSIGFFLHKYLLFFNIILLFILITPEVSLSTLAPIGRSEVTNRTFSYHCAHNWNYISQNVPTDVLCVCFKKLVRTHILAHSIPQFRLNI